MSATMYISENIKRLRTLKNMSQKEVALTLNMDQPQYSRIESGKVEPTLTTLEKIAKVFDVSLSELVKENNEIDKELNLPLLEKVKQIDGLEENEKQSILTVIDIALAKKRFKDNLSNLLTT